jgi:DNA gyrase/topoisomerase IV subunit A
MPSEYQPPPEAVTAAARLDYLDAALKAAEHRDEVSRVIGDAADFAAARVAVAELLGVPLERAEQVMELRLGRLSRASVAEMHSERTEIVDRYGDPRASGGPP